MQREALDFLLFLRMKAANAGHVSGADPEMLRLFGAAPDFPDRLPDQSEQEPARRSGRLHLRRLPLTAKA
jgi:hypothetical protein